MSKTKTYWKGYSEKHHTPDFSISSQKEFQDDVPANCLECFKLIKNNILKVIYLNENCL